MFHFDLMTTQAGKDIHAMGKQEGVEEGEINATRKLLLSLLTFHFGEIPVSLQQQIHVINSSARLNDLFETAAQCQRLDEFEVFLDKTH